MPLRKTKDFNPEEKRLAKIGRAIAHPARIRILKFLDHNGPSSHTAIADNLPLAASTVSEHLRKLYVANLITINQTPNGKSVYDLLPVGILEAGDQLALYFGTFTSLEGPLYSLAS